MDVFTAAFAQIVSLMADYAAQKGSKETLSIKEFVEWSATHGHTELMRAVESNQAITIGVKAAFAEGRDELLDKLRALDEKLTVIASGLGPLDDIARATHPQAALSPQARRLLITLEESKAETLLEVTNRRGRSLWIDGGNANGQFQPDEPRFYDDDLNTLVVLGLLALSHSSGQRMFRPTRLGAQIGKQLLAESAA